MAVPANLASMSKHNALDEGEGAKCPFAAQRLVRSAWARHRIRLLADALLRNWSLSGDEILGLASNHIVTPDQSRARAVACGVRRGATGNI